MNLERLTLEKEWQELFKTELPKYIHKAYAKKYIKWQRENKGFPKNLEKQIDKLLQNYERGLSQFTPSSPFKIEIKTGTKLIRDFKGVKYEVLKIDTGFEYNGNFYKSLSAIANEITGTRWNGKKFFGVIK